ncbi:hypothetical protein CDAR_376561 [Caerostris darwini]|uniref:Uncharacterized protein n=1 Tax=Caerostris darwini TaxID=1538125 RepID=A0AAV4RC07_9ARAC|nr:hypothetical protein CDAR_376561 [Caerostris darwini]
MEGAEVKKKKEKRIRIYPLPVDFRLGFGKQGTPLRPQMTGLGQRRPPFRYNGRTARTLPLCPDRLAYRTHPPVCPAFALSTEKKDDQSITKTETQHSPKQNHPENESLAYIPAEASTFRIEKQ